MAASITILSAQINPTVGAIVANTEKIIKIIRQDQDAHDVIIFPELVVTGYPPEDLLLRPNFHSAVEQALRKIKDCTNNCYVIVGHPDKIAKDYFNAASVFFQQTRIATYHKQCLPNYGVFDELRYFTPGKAAPCILTINGYRFGLCICEDIWHPTLVVTQLVSAKVNAIFCLNASPFDYNKQIQRENILKNLARQGIATIYVNQVGGQDELVFDGQSMVVSAAGKICARAPAFEENLQSLAFTEEEISGVITPCLDFAPLIYKALVCGTYDYVRKNGFSQVLLGLSGGVDSALTLAIAVDALGAENVHALFMPSRYTSNMSYQDVKSQAAMLAVRCTTLSIEQGFKTLVNTLAPLFAQLPIDQTEENIQARIRAILLMAVANKTNKIVLTTSNKSEIAIGYSTLYGDLAGAFAVLKDVLKTQVYVLANYRNTKSKVIPVRVLTRPPSAELRAGQTDQDNLPTYHIIDAIIHGYVENNLAAIDLIKNGYSSLEVEKIINLIITNEYKRRQAPPGIKISPRAFDKDWRWPITSFFR